MTDTQAYIMDPLKRAAASLIKWTLMPGFSKFLEPFCHRSKVRSLSDVGPCVPEELAGSHPELT